MSRYLTEEEKTAEVACWLAYRDEAVEQAPPGHEAGGYGYPDPDIFPLTDALNALPGVMTEQSCAGHLHPGEATGETAMWNGLLWLRLSEAMMERFTNGVYELYEHEVIERCSRHFHKDVGDIAEIVFQGNNRGRLEESARIILDFFTAFTRNGEGSV